MNTMTNNNLASLPLADAIAEAVTPPAAPPAASLLTNKVAISFLTRDTDVQLVTDSSRIGVLMTGNAFYPSPFPALATLAAAQAAFAAAVNALDRSKPSTVRRDQTRLVLVQQLRELALYVQHASGGDPEKLLSSGFPMQRKRGAIPGELQAPKKTDGSKQSDLPQSALAAACWYRELKVSLTRASSSDGLKGFTT